MEKENKGGMESKKEGRNGGGRPEGEKTGLIFHNYS